MHHPLSPDVNMNEKKQEKIMEDVPRLQIEAVMSVSPLKVTEPRRVRRVLVSDDDDNTEIFGGCYHVVMYYENVMEEECGGAVVGWTVESLARALSEHPLLAGRLRRMVEEGEGGGRRGMEIVCNDSGIRMVEARISVSLTKFLEWNQKDDVEGELAFWKDIDEQSPEFSPLFYLQVTRFECGGYSIGISCSLLVSEIVMVDNFLKKWADIHSNIVPRNGEKITPIYFHPRLKNPNPESPPSNIISRSPHKNRGRTLIFKITAQDSHSDKELAMLCVNEAQQKLHRNMGSQFSLFVKESPQVFKVQNCCNTEYSRIKNETMSTARTRWDDFGEYEVEFQEGNRPVFVSRWIGSSSDIGNVVAVPCPKQGVPAVIVVTFPSK